MADLSLLDVVAREAIEEFDPVAQRSAAARHRLRQAAVVLERLLETAGKGDEARILADDVARLIDSPTGQSDLSQRG